MRRQEPDRVPIDEIRRTLEDLDGQRTRNRAGKRSESFQLAASSSLGDQTAEQHRKEPVRVPLSDIRRTIQDLDRQYTKARTVRRHESQQALTQSRLKPVRVMFNKICQKLDYLDPRYHQE
jgi:hypothetical protein